MATIVQFPQKPLEEQAEEFLINMPARFAACHGFGHNFPKPMGGRKGKKIKGLTLRRYPEGQELEAICQDCGMVRIKVAAPGEVFEWPTTRYIYLPPKGYAAPKGTGKFLSKAMYANESYRRYEEEQENPTGGEDMAEEDSPKQPKFSG
jgi:hypothetical protein